MFGVCANNSLSVPQSDKQAIRFCKHAFGDEDRFLVREPPDMSSSNVTQIQTCQAGLRYNYVNTHRHGECGWWVGWE